MLDTSENQVLPLLLAWGQANPLVRAMLITSTRAVPNTVDNTDREADCTVAITLENLAALLSGELEPATGFMMGRFKVSGDMSVALKLQRVV